MQDLAISYNGRRSYIFAAKFSHYFPCTVINRIAVVNRQHWNIFSIFQEINKIFKLEIPIFKL